MSEEKRPRIYIEISGGNLQTIVADGEVEIVVVDYDNAEDDEFDSDSAAAMIEGEIYSGTAADFDKAVAEAKDALEEIAAKNEDAFAP
jgi:hypothetical protein